ncbi:MAG: hypothetical protein ACPGO3_00330 [Magnetospiraceae bacterium]
MKKFLYIFAMIVPLGACGLTPQGDLVREVVKSKSEQAGEATLENTEWLLCDAARVGSVLDRYGDRERWQAYLTLCRGVRDIDAPQTVRERTR